MRGGLPWLESASRPDSLEGHGTNPSALPTRPLVTVAADASKVAAELEPDESPRMERMVGVGVTWKLAGQVGIQLIRLLTVAILARLLTPADYGIAAIAIVLASFAPTVADMGIGSALVQAKAAPPIVRSTAFWASIASGIGLFVLTAAAATPIAQGLGEPQVAELVTVGGLTFAVYSVGSASQAVLMRDMRFRSIELRTWLGLLGGAVVAVTAAAGGAGAWALVLQQVAYMGILAAALWWRASWRPSLVFSGSAFRDLGSFAIRIAGGRWARLAELLVLSLLIGALASVPDLGAWTFAMSMVILPLSLVAIPIAEVLFSAFSRLRDEPERMAALWLNSIAYLAAVLLPLLLGLMIVSPDLVPVVFGSRWEVSVGVVQILCIYVLIRGLQSWGSVYMDAVGRPEVTFWTQLASLCLTPIGVVIGVNWGIEGVAACFVVCQLIAVEIPMLVIVLSHMHLSFRTVARRLMGIAAASLVMAAACLLGRSALEALGVGMGGRAAATIGIGMVVYLACLWWLAPQISRHVVDLCRRQLTRAINSRRRRPALQS
jgi:O-antigen/teichoic acid export membrane protein